MATSREVPLPKPTNSTASGPKLCLEGSALALEYDHENDSGAVDWTTVLFEDVLAVSYRQEVCCAAEQIVDCRRVHVIEQAPWFIETMRNWERSLGTDAWQTQQGGAARYAHYRVGFDDVACVDVVAATCRVGQGARSRLKC